MNFSMVWSQPECTHHFILSAGVSHEALSFADQPVIIPQAPGFVDSFNVSVAAALTLYEARSSRIRAVGRNGDLTEEQQRILTAAMLLRHKARAVFLSLFQPHDYDKEKKRKAEALRYV